MTDNAGVQPGWHPDPVEPDNQRYWDGEQWVGESLPIDAPAPDGPLLAQPAPAPPPIPPTNLSHPNLPPSQPPPAGLFLLPGSPAAMAMPLPGGQPLAPLGSRLLARLIDIAAVLVLNVIANGWFVYQYIKVMTPWWHSYTSWVTGGGKGNPPELPDRATGLLYAMLFVLLAVWAAYEVPSIAGTGQTFGKRIMGLRVVRLDNPDSVGVGRSFRRWLNMAFPIVLWQCCGVGFILQFFDAIACVGNRPYQQCIHDRSVQTVVINVREGEHRDPADPR